MHDGAVVIWDAEGRTGSVSLKVSLRVQLESFEDYLHKVIPVGPGLFMDHPQGVADLVYGGANLGACSQHIHYIYRYIIHTYPDT